MNKFNNQAIAEAAYYIWKNNGCPANTHSQDWNAAINQLSAMAALKAPAKKNNSTRSLASKAIRVSAAKSSVAASNKTSAKKTNTSKTAKKSK